MFEETSRDAGPGPVAGRAVSDAFDPAFPDLEALLASLSVQDVPAVYDPAEREPVDYNPADYSPAEYEPAEYEPAECS